MSGDETDFLCEFASAKIKMKEEHYRDPTSPRQTMKEVLLIDEWKRLFSGDAFLEKLKSNALNGKLGTKHFRSVCWRVFWECLPESRTLWKADVVDKRKWYTEIRKKYVINPHQETEGTDLDKHHPLSLAEDSIWNKFFQDNELRTLITQDLERLYPEIEFFRAENIQSYLLHVLFCYARENTHISYKQGMHEILAPLIYLMYKECKMVENSKEELGDEIRFILDINHLEHDVYYLFHNLMESIQSWYVNLRPLETPKQMHQNQREMFQKPDVNLPVNAISNKLQRIQEHMLPRYDQQLCAHLKNIQITPQVYGIRWMRLLFGREFPMKQLLVLWDAIFANGVTLELVEYIYLAMLIHLRDVLLQNDLSNCLAYLMKFPDTDARYILQRAIFLKNTSRGPPTRPVQQRKPVTVNERHKPHPVKYRLGDTEQQKYAHALGSGVAHPSPKKSAHPSTKSRFYVDSDETDGTKSEGVASQPALSLFREVKAEASERSTKAIVASQISNIRDRVGTTSQFISRVNTLIRANDHQNIAQQEAMISTIAEDHARLQKQVSDLQSELDHMKGLFVHCEAKMDFYLNVMQQRLFEEEQFADELAILGFTGLKQVREVLKSRAVDDVDFSQIDKHIKQVRKEHPSNVEPVADLTANFSHFASSDDSPQVTDYEQNFSSSVAPVVSKDIDPLSERRDEHSELHASELDDP